MKKEKVAKVKKDPMELVARAVSDVSEFARKRLTTFDQIVEDDIDTGFYITIVFQNEHCALEFIENHRDYYGFKGDDQIFVNGHELAKKLGTPLTEPYLKKTVSPTPHNLKSIMKVGIND